MTRLILTEYAAVAIGGAVGSMLRCGIANAIEHRTVGAFPWGTVVVNVVGSFIIGFLFVFTIDHGRFALSPMWRNLIFTGLLGGFTTFSTFSVQTIALVKFGQPALALWNVLGSVATCLAACAAGWWLALQIR